MNAPAPKTSRRDAVSPVAPNSGREKLTRSGYFLGAVLLHLVVFLLFATRVIFPRHQEPTDIFQPVAVRTAPPPPIAPPPPLHEMTVTATTLDPADAILSEHPSPFSLPPLSTLTHPVTVAPKISTPSRSLNSPDAPGYRYSTIRKMEEEKWQRPLDNIEAAPGDPKSAVAKFPVYLASYADGDWSCNVHLKDQRIDAGSLPDLVAKIQEWSDGRLKAELAPQALDVGGPDLLEKMPLFIFFTGHKDFRLTDAEIGNLQAYLSRGGCIWGDNALAGRGSRFDVAFRREMKLVVPDPDKSFEPLSMTADLFTKDRWFTFNQVPAGMNYFTEPLEHLDLGGKIAILYTPNDYSDLFSMRILPGDQAFAGSMPTGDSPLFTNQLFAFDAPEFFRNYSLASCLAAQRLGMNIVGYLLVRFDDRLLLAP